MSISGKKATEQKMSNIKKTYYYLKRNGVLKTIGATQERVFSPYYKEYVYAKPEESILAQQRERKWKKEAVFSILVPAYHTKEEYLRCLINSVREQTYPFWQLVIADGGKSREIEDICKSYEDERILYAALTDNEGISGNTNRGLDYVTGDYTGLLDHDDFLAPDALYEMADALEKAEEKGISYAFLYSDEDKCDERGEVFYEPHFKTDFNFDLLLTNNYICHFLLVSTTLMKELKLRKEYDGAQDFDFALRAVGRILDMGKQPETMICHVPKVLYHWRCHNNSTASNPASKRYAYNAGKEAIYDFCTKRGWKVDVEELAHLGFYRVKYHGGIFAQRKDVGAVVRKRIVRLKIRSGIYDKQGKPMYDGMPFWYSGYIHRAVLTQNAYEIDVDRWELNPEVKKKYEDRIEEIKKRKDISKKEKRKMLCELLRREGYRFYWNPDS